MPCVPSSCDADVPSNSRIEFTSRSAGGDSINFYWANNSVITEQHASNGTLRFAPRTLAANVTQLTFAFDQNDPAVVHIHLRSTATWDGRSNDTLTVITPEQTVRMGGGQS